MTQERPMLIVDYTGYPEGTPFVRVLGLTLAERAVLAAQSAGLESVLIAAAGEVADGIKALLLANERVRAATTIVSGIPSGEADAVMPGNAVVTAAGMKGLVEGRWTFADPPADLVGFVRDGDVRPAETLLLASLRKSADGVVSRHINRHVSLFVSRRLARLPVHPNHITAVVFLIGACSGVFAFFMNSYAGFLIGGLCYYVSAILDGCDGEIARLKHLGSPLGAWLDTVVDDLVGLSFALGLYGRLALDLEGWWPAIGVATVALYLATLLPRYWVMAVSGSGDFQKLAAKKKPSVVTGPGRIVEWARDVFFRTDFIPFFAFVTTAAGLPLAFAVPFSLGIVASAADSIADVVRVSRYRAGAGAGDQSSR